MKSHDTIFNTEWSRFLKANGFSSTKEAIENTEVLFGFSNQPETIARFCSGKRSLSETHIDLFSKLFGVRPEYLSGKDSFRTDEDIALYKKKEETIVNGLYTVFNNLGSSLFIRKIIMKLISPPTIALHNTLSQKYSTTRSTISTCVF